MEPVFFHIDVNSAFLSWEAVYRLYHLGGKVDLRDEVAEREHSIPILIFAISPPSSAVTLLPDMVSSWQNPSLPRNMVLILLNQLYLH